MTNILYLLALVILPLFLIGWHNHRRKMTFIIYLLLADTLSISPLIGMWEQSSSLCAWARCDDSRCWLKTRYLSLPTGRVQHCQRGYTLCGLARCDTQSPCMHVQMNVLLTLQLCIHSEYWWCTGLTCRYPTSMTSVSQWNAMPPCSSWPPPFRTIWTEWSCVGLVQDHAAGGSRTGRSRGAVETQSLEHRLAGHATQHVQNTEEKRRIAEILLLILNIEPGMKAFLKRYMI